MERFFSRILRKNKMTALIELGRPWNAILVVLLSILGASLTLGNLPNLSTILILLSVITLIYIGSSAINDLFDMRVDSINMPFRPLERGSLRVKDVIYFSLFSYSLAIFVSYLISFHYFLSIILMAISSIIYSLPPFSLKDRGILGNIDLGFTTTFTTLYSGSVLITKTFSIPEIVIISSISLTAFFTFFSILKDFKDMKGDKIHHKETVVIRFGLKNALAMNILGTSIFLPLTIYLFYQFVTQSLLFLIFSVLLFIFLLLEEIKLFKNPVEEAGEKIWGESRLIFLIFVAILLIF